MENKNTLNELFAKETKLKEINKDLMATLIKLESKKKKLNMENKFLVDLIMDEIDVATSDEELASQDISGSDASEYDFREEIKKLESILPPLEIKKVLLPEKKRKRERDINNVETLSANGKDEGLKSSAQKKRRKIKARDERTTPKTVEELPKDENGNLILPVEVVVSKANVKILAIGKVVYDREQYHSNRYIFPVGFKSQRAFTSITDPSARCLYTCEILDNGDAPLFKVTPTDTPDTFYTGLSPSGAWRHVLDAVSKANSVQSKSHASGPDYFGLSNL
jgi:hypothetical protein